MAKFLDSTGLAYFWMRLKEKFGEYAKQVAIAEPYSMDVTYAVGDFMMQDGELYKCTTAIETPEKYQASHWEKVHAMDCIGTSSVEALTTQDIVAILS